MLKNLVIQSENKTLRASAMEYGSVGAPTWIGGRRQWAGKETVDGRVRFGQPDDRQADQSDDLDK